MKKTYIIILTILGLFITVTGASFAFFLISNDNESFDTTVTAAMIANIDFVHGPDLVIPPEGIYPGWAGIQEFTIATPDGLTEGKGAFEIILEATVPSEFAGDLTIEVYKTTTLTDTITITPLDLEDYTTQTTLKPINDEVTSNQINITSDTIKAESINILDSTVSLDQQSFDLATWEDTKYFVVYRYINSNYVNNGTMNMTISSTITVNSINEIETKYTDTILAGSDPQINDRMIPVDISTDGVVTIADTTEEWYNYTNSEWANAVLVTNDFLIRTPGTTIPMEKINQMYVWIPRYEYTKSSIESSSDAIDIKFVPKSTTNTDIESQDTIVHPAFTFGDDEVSGIWVAKFEMGADYSIKPNQNSRNNYGIGSDFTNILLLSNGLAFHASSDFHLMKNTEWGAVAYLSQSKYGICNDNGTCTEDNTTTGTPLKVANNNYYEETSKNITTGCGGGDTSQIGVCPAENRWETANGIKASTTHNITGIYDMAGGRQEYVMGVMKSSDNTTIDWSPNKTYGSGFQVYPIPTDTKYYDLYDYGTTDRDTSAYSRGLYGDATIELNPSSGTTWNEDRGTMINNISAFFLRGGQASSDSSGGIWGFYSNFGSGYNDRTVRPVISIIANY